MCFATLTCIMSAANDVANDSVRHDNDALKKSLSTSNRLDEVVVTGSRNAVDLRHLPMTVSIVNRKQLTEQYQPSILPTVMQYVPGLFVTSRGVMGYGVSNGGAGGINMRGITGGAGQLLVLIDGHPQYNGIYGHPISDSYQSLMAERVEILRGPASVLYGSNAMGGVMNIVTRSMNTDGRRTTINIGAGSYGSLQTEATNMYRKGKFNSIVSAQYNRSDNHRPRMGFEQYGGHLKIGYDISKYWTTSIDADITHFNASYPGTTTKPMFSANQWITRGVVSGSIRNNYDSTNGELSVYTNFGRHKIDDGTQDADNPTQRYFRSKDALAGISAYQSAQLFQGNRLTIGVDYQHIYGHAFYTSKETGEIIATPNKQSGKSHRNEIATYVDFRQELLPWFTIDAGIRFDYHNVTGSEWIPQAGFVVRPMASAEIKTLISKGFRNPTMREMYLYPPSNEELKPERLWNYEISWRHRLNRINYAVNFYYIKGDNMIQTINRKNINTGEIENYGAEIEANYHINSHWQLTTNHSLLHMKTPVVASPQYSGFAGANYTARKWHINAGLQYIGGLFTEVGSNETKENFCLLTATVTYKATQNLSLWLRGDNLLAQQYEINRGYPMPKATFMGGINVDF